MLIGVIGVPGEGKSHFARSCAEEGKTAVAVFDDKEQHFYSRLNTGGNGVVRAFKDEEWRPHLDQYNATAWSRLLKWVGEKIDDDEIKYIVLDPLSDGFGCDIIMNEVLKTHRANDPGAVPHGRAYTSFNQHLKVLLSELRLASSRGKTVVVTFHARMREMEGAGVATKGQSMSGKEELQFEERMLPMLPTSFRQMIGGYFDVWAYTKTTGYGAGVRRWLTLIPDNVRPAKHSIHLKDGVNPAQIPNTMHALQDAILPVG